MRAMLHGRALSLLLVLAGPAILTIGLPHRAAAQQCIICGGDVTPPTTSISPSGGTFTTGPTVTVTIRWCDEESLLGNHEITFDGVDQTFSYSSGANTNCDNSGPANAVATGSVTLAPGTNTLNTHICDTSDNCANSSVTYTYSPPPPSSIVVTPVGAPDGGMVTVTANSGTTQAFTITSTGGPAGGVTYTLSAQCTPTASCASTSVSPRTVTILSGHSASGTVSYGVGGDGTTGTVQLTATYNSSIHDAGEVTVAAQAPCQVADASLSPCGGRLATVVTSTTGIRDTVWLTNQTGFPMSYENVTCTVTAPLTSCTPPADGAMNSNDSAAIVTTANSGPNQGEGTLHVLLSLGAGDEQVAASAEIDVLSPSSVVVQALTTGLPHVNVDDTASRRFTVYNAGPLTAKYRIAPSCGLNVASCAAPTTQTTLTPGVADTVTVSFTAGGTPGALAQVGLTATHVDNDQITSTAHTNVLVNAYGATVTAAQDSMSVQVGPHTTTFTVHNTSTDSATFVLSTPCTSPVTDCSAPASVHIDSGATATVNVAYTASTASISGGFVRLRAMLGRGATIAAEAAMRITAHTAAAGGQPQVALVNSDSLAARDLCLTIAAGPNAAYGCGDLRLVHALPSIRTMNKQRTPVLLYDSRFAEPHPLVAVNATLLPDTVAPDTIEAVLKIDGATQGTTVQWSGSGWVPGTTRRLVIPVDNAALETGVHSYQLEVTNIYPSVRRPAPTMTGSFVVVNRAASHFGAGWWLAGLEQLFFPSADTTTRLWVGGDGSVRVYRKVSNGVWAAPAVDRPDTLTWDGTNYVRHASHSVRVVFDGQGYHTETVNRLGFRTTFTYVGDTLTSIDLPPSGTGHSYFFDYSTPGQVAIDVPPIGSAGGSTTLLLTNGKLTAIRDPDYQLGTHPYVGFGYDSASARIKWRKDKRGTTVSYTYDAGQALRTVSIPLNETETATTTFVASESQGLAPQVLLAGAASTLLDGPRADADVADTTRFWLDRFGGPQQIRDALGDTTVLARTDPDYPALVTRLRQPNGHVMLAEYNDRGNVAAVTDSAPYSGTTMATTTYEWDPKWDFVTKIARPEGDVITFSYDATTGNRLWQQDGRGEMSRVTFRYYDSTATLGPNLLRAIEQPTVPGTPVAIDSLSYDEVSNLAGQRSARGFWTRYSRDVEGRATIIHRPVGPTGSAIQEDSLNYDVMGRVTREATAGPALNGAPAQELIVETFYNVNGQPDSLRRSTIPSTTIGSMTTSWSYDSAGRVIAETAPDQKVDSSRYDLAGNVIWQRTRRAKSAGDTISMQYDALNRLITRHLPAVQYAADTSGIPTLRSDLYTADCDQPPPANSNCHNPPYRAYAIPADTAIFRYDAVGHLVVADNQYARVHRSYYPNGLLERDSLYIRTLADTVHGGDFTTHHAYGLVYSYNLDGQVVDLAHPVQLAPVINGAVHDHTQYGYDGFTGQLASVIDVAGNQFRPHNNARGELDSLYLPWDVTEGYGYDPEGSLAVHQVASTTRTVRRTTLTRDASGKILTTTNQFGKQDTLSASYSGLGYLTHSELIAHDSIEIPVRYHTGEDFTYDALGNALTSVVHDTIGGKLDSSNAINTYTPTTGRLARAERFNRNDTSLYNAAGDLEFTTQRHVLQGSALQDRASYYAADGSLGAAEYRTVASAQALETLFTTVFEQYRYDALGRRVLVWAQRWCENGALNGLPPAEQETARRQQAECNLSLVRRTVWDGERELYEIQMPGDSTMSTDTLENDTAPVDRTIINDVLDPNPFFGRVVYAYGLGIDEPLSITRINYADTVSGKPYAVWAPFTIIPLWNTRQQADTGFFSDGRGIHQLPTDTTRHVKIDWPMNWHAYGAPDPILYYWHGTLLDGKRDKAETMYRRNRVYDPETGRFTQEDPIGLAGGLNLYGFTAGDPVNLSDPFGLCPPQDNNPYTCPGRMGAFVMLGQMAPAMNHEVAWFLPRNLAAAVASVTIEAALGRAVAAVRSWFSAGSAAEAEAGVTTQFGSKIMGQLGKRGWTEGSVEETIANPARTSAARDTRWLPDGTRMDDPATTYYNNDGSYVVRNNVSGDVVQVSNRNNPNWKSPQ